MSFLPNPNALVVISKGMQTVKLLQQNPPVLNRGSHLMQVVLYNGRKAVVVVVVVAAVVLAVAMAALQVRLSVV